MVESSGRIYCRAICARGSEGPRGSGDSAAASTVARFHSNGRPFAWDACRPRAGQVCSVGFSRFLDTRRRIRAEPWGTKTVLIALTGWGRPGDIDKARAAGFDGHLLKPVEAEAMIDLIGQLRNAAG